MKKFTKIVLIIAACLIAVGGLTFGVTCYIWSGNTSLRADDGIKSYKYVPDKGFSNIFIESSCADVSFEVGSEYKVEFTNVYDLGTRCEIKDDTLFITVHSKSETEAIGWKLGYNADFRRSISSVRVVVPKADAIKILDAEVGIGSVNIYGINASEIIAQSATGSISLLGCTSSESCNLQTGIGNIAIDFSNIRDKSQISIGSGRFSSKMLIAKDMNVEICIGYADLVYGDEASKSEVHIDQPVDVKAVDERIDGIMSDIKSFFSF